MLTVIKPFCKEFKRESRMDQVLSKVLVGREVEYILTVDELENRDLRGRKLLFAVCLSEAGINLEYYRMLEYFRKAPDCLQDSHWKRQYSQIRSLSDTAHNNSAHYPAAD